MNAELAGSFNPTIHTTKTSSLHLLVGRHQFPNLERLATTFNLSTTDKMTYDGNRNTRDLTVKERGFMAQAKDLGLPLTLKLRMRFARLAPFAYEQQGSITARGELYLFRMKPEGLAQAQYPAAGNWVRSYISLDVNEEGGHTTGSVSIRPASLVLSENFADEVPNLTWEEFEWVTELERIMATARLHLPHRNGQVASPA